MDKLVEALIERNEKDLAKQVMAAVESFNPDKVKEGTVLGIGSSYSKKAQDYVPIEYEVSVIFDVSKLKNLREKFGLSHLFGVYSSKRRELGLDIFKDRYVLWRGADAKTVSKGKFKDIKVIKY